MLQWLLDKSLKFLQWNCKHPSEFVNGDILEGDQEPMLVIKWCKRCGALMFINEPAREYWRLPNPDLVRKPKFKKGSI